MKKELGVTAGATVGVSWRGREEVEAIAFEEGREGVARGEG